MISFGGASIHEPQTRQLDQGTRIARPSENGFCSAREIDKCHNRQCDAIPAERGERMRLDIMQQPFHRDKGDGGGDQKPQQHHAPMLRRRARNGMTQLLENLKTTRRKHRGNAHKKGKFHCRRTIQAKQQTQHNRRAGPRRAGKHRRNQLANADGNDDGPGDFVAQFSPAQPPFDGDKTNAADKPGPGNGRELFRQFESFFFED